MKATDETNDLKDAVNFFFELGMLRKTEHQGLRLIGVDNPGSVAAHSLRAAQIGYVLAKMEGHDNPQEVCSLIVFHDIGECRVGDINKVNARYVKADEERAVDEQLSKIGSVGDEIKDMWLQVEKRSTAAGNIAKDADYVEQAVLAKEYVERGYEYAQDWIDNCKKVVKTKSALKLLEEIDKANSNEWWQGLKKIE
ncbi:HD domain-containing protein [Candidatus Woesearchaeota archaeon]|nr:HD domain-containing protein [Candidatus Woesearchaeota archaeon]